MADHSDIDHEAPATTPRDSERFVVGSRASYTTSLITQGSERFFTLSLPSDLLAETCIIEPRNEAPVEGFQRALDRKRAAEIAAYIDSGYGTIPSSIVLSAQPDAKLEYKRTTRTLSFDIGPRSFLILDGQHRVYGFMLAKTQLRVPVVIYNGLSRVQECRLFMDINTKQRPVPAELILDIKRLAESESDSEALLRDVFDGFDQDPSSPLFGLMSPSERKKGRISRVTFNAALKPILDTLSGADASYVYEVLSAYVKVCVSGLRKLDSHSYITNSTVFRSFMLLFPTVAERVADRFSSSYTVHNFNEVMAPMFDKLKKSEIQKPGTSHIVLHEIFRKALKANFTIGRT